MTKMWKYFTSWEFLIYLVYLDSSSEAFLNYLLIHHLFKNANLQRGSENTLTSISSPKPELSIKNVKHGSKYALTDKLVPMLEAEEDCRCDPKEVSSKNKECKTKQIEKLCA